LDVRERKDGRPNLKKDIYWILHLGQETDIALKVFGFAKSLLEITRGKEKGGKKKKGTSIFKKI